jgi:single-strand DNA-binding protein
MNRCVLIGNLTRDPELKTTTSGLSVCNFTIAVSRSFSSQSSGEREADFIPVVVWRKQAENAAKYLRKGSQVGVAGSLQTRSYEAKDGSRRYITEVVANEVQFLSRVGDGGGASNTGGRTVPSDMQEINEELPF